MIRQSPEVPIAVELVDVAKHVMSTQVINQISLGIWAWHCPEEYNPVIRLFAAEKDRTISSRMTGRLAIKYSEFVIVDEATEYKLIVDSRTAKNVPDDPYLEDFKDAFRQYKYGRSKIFLPN